MKQRFNNQGGFTLIEMMIVIAVIGILLSIAAPSLFEHFRNVSLQDAAYQICGDLHISKSQAIRSQASCQIAFNSPATDQYQLTSPNRTIDLSTYSGNVTFTGNPGDGSADIFTNTIAFNARGTADSAGQVYLTNRDNRVYRVQTSAAGGISVKKWNGSKWY